MSPDVGVAVIDRTRLTDLVPDTANKVRRALPALRPPLIVCILLSCMLGTVYTPKSCLLDSKDGCIVHVSLLHVIWQLAMR